MTERVKFFLLAVFFVIPLIWEKYRSQKLDKNQNTPSQDGDDVYPLF